MHVSSVGTSLFPLKREEVKGRFGFAGLFFTVILILEAHRLKKKPLNPSLLMEEATFPQLSQVQTL